MAKTYYFRISDAPDGSTILPVAGDPEYTVTGFDNAMTIGNAVVVFLDGSGDPVTPTGGTVEFEGSPIEGIFLPPPSVVTINATDVIVAPGTASYTLPSFDGPMVGGRVRFTGITGAVSAKCYMWRATT